MLALENCKEGDSVIPMQVLVQVELLTIRTRASTSTKCDSNAVPSLSAPPSLELKPILWEEELDDEE